MPAIKNILDKYHKELDYLDLELIISRVIKKPREFVLAHPEKTISINEELKIKKLINRRKNHEPLAYILGHKEFYGLDFKVNKHVLILRPETELLVELALWNIKSPKVAPLPQGRHKTLDKRKSVIIDVGTGSGNIITSLANELKKTESLIANYELIGTDISAKALRIAKYNARKNNVAEDIQFLQGNLLEPILNPKSYKLKAKNYFIVANLPYLSRKIYSETSLDIRKFEPKSALLSKNNGLDHYDKLLKQISQLKMSSCVLDIKCYMEISPEQKKTLEKMIKKYFLGTKIKFHKDMANKWRVVEFAL